MDGLSFQNLPATQQDPMGILKSRYDKSEQYLRSQYDTELNSLKQQSLADKEFFNQLNQLNSKYEGALNQERYKADQQVQSVKRVQDLINAGQIAPDAGQEAVWRLVLPSETERAMFQAAGQGQPFSISQITSGAVMESVMEFAEAAPTIGKFWTRESKEPKTQQGLLSKYLGWRELIGYDAIKSPVRQNQLDLQWDAYMAGDERFDEWWSDKSKREPIVEIKALRTPGNIGKIMRSRVTGATGASPLGRSISRSKSRKPEFGFPGGPPLTPTPKAAPQQLSTPTTQAEYDRVPSGTRYMGTDGQIRTKH